MKRISAARQSWLILLGVFLLMWALNAMCYRFYGDDYLYSFVWEGHAMSVPLSAHARRIQGFGDIFYSLKLHYMTWGGRMVVHFFTMLFLWVGKGWFDVVNAGMVVLLLLAMQWIAGGGRFTVRLSPFITALSFFCIWTFNMSFGGGPCSGWPVHATTCGLPYFSCCFSFPMYVIISPMDRRIILPGLARSGW